MGNAYWYLEYTKVFLAYLFLMFVYPSVVFRSYLRGRGKVFWFGFCVSSMIVLISSVVLMLGLLHILNVWIFRVLFYGSFFWAVYRSGHLPMTPRYLIYKMTNRTYGWRLLLVHLRAGIRQQLRKLAAFLRRQFRHNAIEVIGLSALLIFAVIYFSYGDLREHYYGYGDLYVHHSWIYGLMQGQPFSGNVYPEGMHCIAYAINALFGIRVYNVLLYMQCAHVLVFLLSAYLLVRELFPWKYSALLMLAGFLSLKVDCVNEVYAISRLQWSLPQEFGLFSAFLIPLFLIRYLRRAGSIARKGKNTKMYWNCDLLVFLLAIAASFAVHFYATIMAILSCMAVAVVLAGKLFYWRRFVPVAATAVLAIVIAAAPMGLALAEGIPVQGSIFWALNIMNGEAYDPTVSAREQFERSAAIRERQRQEEEAQQIQQEQLAVQNGESQQGSDLPPTVQAPKEPLQERLLKAAQSIISLIRTDVRKIFTSGYSNLYSPGWSSLFACATVLPLGLWLAFRMLAWILKHVFRLRKIHQDAMDGYAVMAMFAALYMVLYTGGEIGIPAVVEGSRLCAVEHMALLSLLAIPVDIVGCGLAMIFGSWLMQGVSLLGAAAVFWLVISTGNYHGYMLFEGSRYAVVPEVTNSIIADMPKDQFTVLSTTDELYQLIEYGFHEEYLTFLQRFEKPDYYIPTKYVFFYLEKHPLVYGQAHFASGPEWLALERYHEFFGNASRCPEVLHGEISPEKAEAEVAIHIKSSSGYTILSNREIVESKASVYINTLLEQYPNEMSVYYEDDDFICYCLEQNPDKLIMFYNPPQGAVS